MWEGKSNMEAKVNRILEHRNASAWLHDRCISRNNDRVAMMFFPQAHLFAQPFPAGWDDEDGWKGDTIAPHSQTIKKTKQSKPSHLELTLHLALSVAIINRDCFNEANRSTSDTVCCSLIIEFIISQRYFSFKVKLDFPWPFLHD